MDERLIELETKIAFQEQTVDTLNEVVTAQQQQLDRLERKVEAFRQQVQKLLLSLPEQGADKPPPHY